MGAWKVVPEIRLGDDLGLLHYDISNASSDKASVQHFKESGHELIHIIKPILNNSRVAITLMYIY